MALATTIVTAAAVAVIAIEVSGPKSYNLATPLGVTKRLVDIALITFEYDNDPAPDPVPALVCNPNENEIFALRWRLQDTEDMYGVGHTLSFDGWTVEENYPKARVTFRVAIRYSDTSVAANEIQTWAVDLKHTDRWRVCSTTHVNTKTSVRTED